MSARTALYGLLVVVAAAAAVLSFSALRDLALLCGFSPPGVAAPGRRRRGRAWRRSPPGRTKATSGSRTGRPS